MKTTNQKIELEKNIGKQGKNLSSTVAGTFDKIGIISAVYGNDIDGYRYELKFEQPIGAMENLNVLYPPTSLTEIL